MDEFERYIKGLKKLNGFGKDITAEEVDDALAYWFTRYYLEGIEFSFEKRDKLIEMLEKSAELVDLVMTSDFKPYLDAALDMVWRKAYIRENERNVETNFNWFMLNAMMASLVMGYALHSLEDKKGQGK